MPWRNGTHGSPDAYVRPYVDAFPNDDTGNQTYAKALEYRKECIRNMEDFTSFQKHFASTKDYEAAKFFKEEVSFWRKQYNACRYVIFDTHRGDRPGDCLDVAPSPDLAKEIDLMFMQTDVWYEDFCRKVVA